MTGKKNASVTVKNGAVTVDFSAKKTRGRRRTQNTDTVSARKRTSQSVSGQKKVSADKEKYPLVDMNEVLALYRSGDPQKKAKAIEMTYLRYRKYVASLARGYFGSFFNNGEHFVSGEDFLSAGNLGLIDGLEHFNPQKGEFTTCCKPYVLKHLSDQACLGSDIPTQHYMNVQKKLKRALDASGKRNTAPSIAQLSKETGLTERIVRDGLEMMRMIPAIPSGLCDYRSEEVSPVVNLIDESDTPEEIILKQEFKSRFDDAIGRKLGIDEGEALCLRFGVYHDIPEKGLSFPEIAKRLGVSDTKARSIVQKALKSLKGDAEVMDLAGSLFSEKKEEYPLDGIVPVFTKKGKGKTTSFTPDFDTISNDLERLLSLDLDTLLA